MPLGPQEQDDHRCGNCCWISAFHGLLVLRWHGGLDTRHRTLRIAPDERFLSGEWVDVNKWARIRIVWAKDLLAPRPRLLHVVMWRRCRAHCQQAFDSVGIFAKCHRDHAPGRPHSECFYDGYSVSFHFFPFAASRTWASVFPVNHRTIGAASLTTPFFRITPATKWPASTRMNVIW